MTPPDLSSRLKEIQARFDVWRANCAEEGGDGDLVAIFEAHSADDVAWLLDQLALLTQSLSRLEAEKAIEFAILRSEIDMLRDGPAREYWEQLQATNERSAKAEAALLRYGQHLYDCQVQNTHDEPKCDCGLADLLTPGEPT